MNGCVARGWITASLGSQNALAIKEFVSRLLPFVSFGAMSYAAGVSCLHFWRFALAKFTGILPASSLPAHFGSEARDGDFGAAEWIALGLGLATALLLVVLSLQRRRPGRAGRTPPGRGE